MTCRRFAIICVMALTPVAATAIAGTAQPLAAQGRQPPRVSTEVTATAITRTDTWMKIGGRWQCVASQDCLLPVGTTQ